MIDNRGAWELAEEFIKRVKEEHITVSITINGDDSMEVIVSPYEPYQPFCPYARQRCAEEDDGR